jgi:hypothetical protein
MKSITSALIFSILFLFSVPANAVSAGDDATVYNEIVMDFVQYMNPKNMEKAWKKRGEAWRKALSKSNSVSTLSALVAEFEENVRESAVLEAWVTRRSGWRSDVKSAKTYTELGDYLVEMEEGITNESKLEGWEEAREGWLDRITESGKKMKVAAEKVEFDAAALRPEFDKVWGAIETSFKDVKTGEGTAVPG